MLLLLLLLLLWLLRMEFVEREKLREKAGEKRSLTIRDPSLHTRAACGLGLISSPSQGKWRPMRWNYRLVAAASSSGRLGR